MNTILNALRRSPASNSVWKSCYEFIVKYESKKDSNEWRTFSETMFQSLIKSHSFDVTTQCLILKSVSYVVSLIDTHIMFRGLIDYVKRTQHVDCVVEALNEPLFKLVQTSKEAVQYSKELTSMLLSIMPSAPYHGLSQKSPTTRFDNVNAAEEQALTLACMRVIGALSKWDVSKTVIGQRLVVDRLLYVVYVSMPAKSHDSEVCTIALNVLDEIVEINNNSIAKYALVLWVNEVEKMFREDIRSYNLLYALRTLRQFMKCMRTQYGKQMEKSSHASASKVVVVKSLAAVIVGLLAIDDNNELIMLEKLRVLEEFSLGSALKFRTIIKWKAPVLKKLHTWLKMMTSDEEGSETVNSAIAKAWFTIVVEHWCWKCTDGDVYKLLVVPYHAWLYKIFNGLVHFVQLWNSVWPTHEQEKSVCQQWLLTNAHESNNQRQQEEYSTHIGDVFSTLIQLHIPDSDEMYSSVCQWFTTYFRYTCWSVDQQRRVYSQIEWAIGCLCGVRHVELRMEMRKILLEVVGEHESFTSPMGYLLWIYCSTADEQPSQYDQASFLTGLKKLAQDVNKFEVLSSYNAILCDVSLCVDDRSVGRQWRQDLWQEVCRKYMETPVMMHACVKSIIITPMENLEVFIGHQVCYDEWRRICTNLIGTYEDLMHQRNHNCHTILSELLTTIASASKAMIFDRINEEFSVWMLVSNVLDMVASDRELCVGNDDITGGRRAVFCVLDRVLESVAQIAVSPSRMVSYPTTARSYDTSTKSLEFRGIRSCVESCIRLLRCLCTMCEQQQITTNRLENIVLNWWIHFVRPCEKVLLGVATPQSSNESYDELNELLLTVCHLSVNLLTKVFRAPHNRLSARTIEENTNIIRHMLMYMDGAVHGPKQKETLAAVLRSFWHRHVQHGTAEYKVVCECILPDCLDIVKRLHRFLNPDDVKASATPSPPPPPQEACVGDKRGRTATGGNLVTDVSATVAPPMHSSTLMAPSIGNMIDTNDLDEEAIEDPPQPQTKRRRVNTNSTSAVVYGDTAERNVYESRALLHEMRLLRQVIQRGCSLLETVIQQHQS